jgi:hypothetical protein
LLLFDPTLVGTHKPSTKVTSSEKLDSDVFCKTVVLGSESVTPAAIREDLNMVTPLASPEMPYLDAGPDHTGLGLIETVGNQIL